MSIADTLEKRLADAAVRIDNRLHWDRLPTPMGLLVLALLRKKYQRENLHDPESMKPLLDHLPPAPDPRWLTTRSLDGTFNDLDQPAMGASGTRFGRNIPLDKTFAETEPRILTPNPRDVSRALLTRDTFKPATTLNVLAAAWLQFEVHDWFNHGKGDWDTAWQLPLGDDDPWHERPMRIPRARKDASHVDDGTPGTFECTDTHWWDASQLYGDKPEVADKERAHEHGKLRVDTLGLPPADLLDGQDLADVAGNFWFGLGLLHTLFALEHNAICDRLRAAYPSWTDDRLYDRARLINSALMAKIHTVEWTPAIIAHPTTRLAMRVNWWGLTGEKVKRRFGRLTRNEVLSGIIGGPRDLHGVPFTLTEEFTAVYRMHPLIPDDYTFRNASDDKVTRELCFEDLTVLHTHRLLEEIGVADGLYSFGTAHPGAITLHNFPRFMQTLKRPDDTVIDLAAVDLMRIRERGVPRYNEFRRSWHMPPVSTFEELTPNPEWAEQIRKVYDDDIESVDLMVGLYGEQPPKGFGFSDTAFRVFVLMASRRLEADRFFTTDYRPEIYTEEGLRWIDDNSLVTIILRHFPQLEPALTGVNNAFVPWNAAAQRP